MYMLYILCAKHPYDSYKYMYIDLTHLYVYTHVHKLVITLSDQVLNQLELVSSKLFFFFFYHFLLVEAKTQWVNMKIIELHSVFPSIFLNLYILVFWIVLVLVVFLFCSMCKLQTTKTNSSCGRFINGEFTMALFEKPFCSKVYILQKQSPSIRPIHFFKMTNIRV